MMALLLNVNDSVSRSYSITKPSPLHPIVPSECGERTENLCDESTFLNGYYETTSYQYYPNDNYRCFSLSLPAGTYTIFAKSDTLTIRLLRVSSASLGANPVNRDNQSYAFTLPVAETIYVSLRNSTTTNDFTGLTTMLNTGITPRPYEPYGYKLPLLSAGQSVDIYLGESQTTRQIGKFDLSQATWSSTGMPGLLRTTDIPNIKYTSSNLEVGNGLAEKYQIHTGSGMSSALNCIAIDVSQVSVNTGSTSIKPTGMLYYALATPETSVVNEPLRKIGNYADTIDSTQTSAQIPTTAGSTTISWAGSGLAPSEFDSIQEWVDIPTYTYTNGAWVAE